MVANGAQDISSFGRVAGVHRAGGVRTSPIAGQKKTPCISLILPQKKGVFRFAKMLRSAADRLRYLITNILDRHASPAARY
jgi:hypothetical protein